MTPVSGGGGGGGKNTGRMEDYRQQAWERTARRAEHYMLVVVLCVLQHRCQSAHHRLRSPTASGPMWPLRPCLLSPPPFQPPGLCIHFLCYVTNYPTPQVNSWEHHLINSSPFWKLEVQQGELYPSLRWKSRCSPAGLLSEDPPPSSCPYWQNSTPVAVVL